MSKGEAKALSDIDKYGLHIIHVMEDENSPPFSYSIGIQKTLNKPELIVIGLKQKVAHFVINECYEKLRRGEPISTGVEVSDLLEGFDCVVGEVSAAAKRDYMGWATWLYQGPDYDALQIIYPSTKGVWPTDPAASDWFRNWQPILAEHN